MHNAYLAVQLNKCRCHPISCLFRKSKFSENCYKFKTEIKYFNYRQDVIERVIYKQLRIWDIVYPYWQKVLLLKVKFIQIWTNGLRNMGLGHSLLVLFVISCWCENYNLQRIRGESFERGGKISDKKSQRPCFGITCAAQQRAATGVSLHELMELGGGGSGGEGEGEERRGEGEKDEGEEGRDTARGGWQLNNLPASTIELKEKRQDPPRCRFFSHKNALPCPKTQNKQIQTSTQTQMAKSLKGRKRVNLDGQPLEHFSNTRVS